MKEIFIRLFSFLERYQTVFSQAWSLRSELLGPKRLVSEYAFLPNALRLQETPVHPAPRRSALVIAGTFIVLIIWSLVGELDIVATAAGQLIVNERTKPIQFLEPGIVKRIFVHDGDKVSVGQTLIELDSVVQTSETKKNDQALMSTRVEILRIKTIQQAIVYGRLNKPLKDQIISTMEYSQLVGMVEAEWADIAKKIEKADAEIATRKAEIVTADKQVHKLRTVLPIIIQREKDFEKLTGPGFISHHTVQDKTKDRLEVEEDLEAYLSKKNEVSAALDESLKSKASFITEVKRNLSERLSQAMQKEDELTEVAKQTKLRKDQTIVKSPSNGVVQQLVVHTPGSVISSGQILMVIVPAESELVAQAFLENRDVPFVKVGQKVEIKLEAFPYTRYGTILGAVQSVSADAVIDEKRGPIFPLVARLRTNTISENDHQVKLIPGMAFVAEIKTGKRPIYRFFFDPVSSHMHESLGER